MTIRGEATRFGIGLAAAGLAFVGTFAGFVLVSLAGLNSGNQFVWFPFLAGVPALLVFGFLALLGWSRKRRLHPLPTAVGILVGGVLEMAFLNIFFLYGLLFFPALFALTAFLASAYLLDRPALSRSELELIAGAVAAAYGYLGSGPLLIALGRFNTQGCSDGCGRTENLITAAVVFILAVFVFAAAVRSSLAHRPPSPVRTPSDL